MPTKTYIQEKFIEESKYVMILYGSAYHYFPNCHFLHAVSICLECQKLYLIDIRRRNKIYLPS